MLESIIELVVEAYQDYQGLDELKRGIKLALDVMAASGISYTRADYHYVFNEVLYRLDG